MGRGRKFISIERAAECYGVVIHQAGSHGYEIDRPATEQLQNKGKKQ